MSNTKVVKVLVATVYLSYLCVGIPLFVLANGFAELVVRLFKVTSSSEMSTIQLTCQRSIVVEARSTCHIDCILVKLSRTGRRSND